MKPRLTALFAALSLTALLAAAPTIEQIAADPQHWPTEVTVTASTRGTILKDGQPAGVMLVGAGKKITVTGIAADGITGKIGGSTVRVAVEKTDLLGGGAPAPAVKPPEGLEADIARTEARAEKAAAAGTFAAPAGPPTRMQRQLSSKLVRLENGRLGGVNTDTALAGVKYYGIYFSASWCGPCRQFTPGFISAYRELKKQHPEFEVIFVSNDRSAGDMTGYMKEDRMPWLALKYDLVNDSELMRYAGPGIPCLVLVDANGKVLSDSFRGDDYLGPQRVLADARRILAKGN